MREDELENYGCSKMVSKGMTIFTKLLKDKELVCKYNLKNISHTYGGKEIPREDFWNLIIHGKL